MDVITNTINIFLQIPAEVWAFILGAAGVSALTEISKKMFALENEKVIVTLFTAISLAASGIEYITTQTNLPPTVLGMNTAILMGIATFLYRFAIKPASVFISAVNAYRSQVSSKIQEIESVNAAAALPNAKVVETNNQPRIIAPVETPDNVPAQLDITPEPKTVDF